MCVLQTQRPPVYILLIVRQMDNDGQMPRNPELVAVRLPHQRPGGYRLRLVGLRWKESKDWGLPASYQQLLREGEKANGPVGRRGWLQLS